MKRPKKLTYNHKKLLSKNGYNPQEFRYLEEDKENILFINPKTGERVWVSK